MKTSRSNYSKYHWMLEFLSIILKKYIQDLYFTLQIWVRNESILYYETDKLLTLTLIKYVYTVFIFI